MAGSIARVIWQRAATKHCPIHEDVKQSTKISNLPWDFSNSQNDKAFLRASITAEENDVFTSTDSWSLLTCQSSPGKMPNWNSGLNPSAQKDYQSALDESFMFRFSKNDEFDSLKAENISLGSFADLKTLLAGEVTDLELGYTQELVCPGLKTDKAGHLAFEDNEDVGDGNEECTQTLIDDATCDSGVNNKLKLADMLKSSSSPAGEHGLVSRARASTLKGSKHLHKAISVASLSNKEKVSWRRADIKELAVLVATKSLQQIENCDLPPSKCQLLTEGAMEGWDSSPPKKHRWEASKSVDREFLTSLLQGCKPVHPETRKHSSSKFLSDPLTLPHHVPRPSNFLPAELEQIPPVKSQPQHILSSKGHGLSFSSGKGDREQQLLGEALYHSQTRAREAEKAAAQAFLEKERLTCLLFREASISLTYRQWVRSLQAENISLRLRARDRSRGNLTKSSLPNVCTFGSFHGKSWRHPRKEFTPEFKIRCNVVKYYKDPKRRQSVGRSNFMSRYSIGLAFAFGLSLAGAGLVLGWSMGWILFAPLRS